MKYSPENKTPFFLHPLLLLLLLQLLLLLMLLKYCPVDGSFGSALFCKKA